MNINIIINNKAKFIASCIALSLVIIILFIVFIYIYRIKNKSSAILLPYEIAKVVKADGVKADGVKADGDKIGEENADVAKASEEKADEVLSTVVYAKVDKTVALKQLTVDDLNAFIKKDRCVEEMGWRMPYNGEFIHIEIKKIFFDDKSNMWNFHIYDMEEKRKKVIKCKSWFKHELRDTDISRDLVDYNKIQNTLKKNIVNDGREIKETKILCLMTKILKYEALSEEEMQELCTILNLSEPIKNIRIKENIQIRARASSISSMASETFYDAIEPIEELDNSNTEELVVQGEQQKIELK